MQDQKMWFYSLLYYIPFAEGLFSSCIADTSSSIYSQRVSDDDSDPGVCPILLHWVQAKSVVTGFF